MNKTAVIVGTGYDFFYRDDSDLVIIDTPYGKSSPVSEIELADKTALFMARHGIPHTVSPHQINYRANMKALSDRGVQHVIAVATVGGITEQMAPGAIIIPDQIVDYTYGREHTFADGEQDVVNHIDFTMPYDERLREQLIKSAADLAQNIIPYGTYAATQGPRLETAAEVERLKKDGCDIIGMTGMPEASLAKELGLAYSTIALSVNWAAGIKSRRINMKDIEKNISSGISKVRSIIGRTTESL